MGRGYDREESSLPWEHSDGPYPKLGSGKSSWSQVIQMNPKRGSFGRAFLEMEVAQQRPEVEEPLCAMVGNST